MSLEQSRILREQKRAVIESATPGFFEALSVYQRGERPKERLRSIAVDEQLAAEIQDHLDRKGELPVIELAVIADKLVEVESVKVTAEADKAKLESDAAKIDGAKDAETKEAALKEIETKEQYLASLESQKLELEFQERLAKGELLKEDEAEIAKRKEAQANLIAEYEAALRIKGLLATNNETEAERLKREERLRNRARIKAALERQQV